MLSPILREIVCEVSLILRIFLEQIEEGLNYEDLEIYVVRYLAYFERSPRGWFRELFL